MSRDAARGGGRPGASASVLSWLSRNSAPSLSPVARVVLSSSRVRRLPTPSPLYAIDSTAFLDCPVPCEFKVCVGSIDRKL